MKISSFKHTLKLLGMIRMHPEVVNFISCEDWRICISQEISMYVVY